jgi:hypothetical protein
MWAFGADVYLALQQGTVLQRWDIFAAAQH